PGTWAIGVTPIFHTGYRPNDPYDEIGAHDYTFTLPNATSFGWTQFYVDVTVPSDAGVKALSVRPHVYSRFTGTVYYDDVTVQVIGTTTGVKDSKFPKTFELANNYPNPFNPTTIIHFAAPSTGAVSLAIYNMLGQQVRMLVNGTVSAGYHDVVWDARDDNGKAVESGVYFYRLQTGTTALVKKMLFIK
ncbi:MAG: T9SS type A sorting domain-containing protein, partial [Bacteroidota bacterium]